MSVLTTRHSPLRWRRSMRRRYHSTGSAFTGDSSGSPSSGAAAPQFGVAPPPRRCARSGCRRSGARGARAECRAGRCRAAPRRGQAARAGARAQCRVRSRRAGWPVTRGLPAGGEGARAWWGTGWCRSRRASGPACAAARSPTGPGPVPRRSGSSATPIVRRSPRAQLPNSAFRSTSAFSAMLNCSSGCSL